MRLKIFQKKQEQKLGMELTKDDMAQLMAVIDQDGDAAIDYQEFLDAILRNNPRGRQRAGHSQRRPIEPLVRRSRVLLLRNYMREARVLDIGVEEEVSIKHLLTIIQSALGTELSIKNMPAPEGETSRRCPDTSKLRRLGFAAKHNLTSGINEILHAHLGGTGR